MEDQRSDWFARSFITTPSRRKLLGSGIGALGVGLYAAIGGRPGSMARSQRLGAIAATPIADACPTSPEEVNGAIVGRWYDAINARDLAPFADLLASDVAYHAGAAPYAEGVSAVQRTVDGVLAGFSDYHVEVDQLITKDDSVVARWTAGGTHDGIYQGLAATGRQATWTGITIFRFACGRIAEAWTEVDGLGRLRQLGAVPIATPTP